jgi:Fis family transcriptional regulator
MNQLPTIELQRQAVNDFFSALAEHQEHLPYVSRPLHRMPISRNSQHEAHDDDDDIATCVGKALENYFQQLEGEKPAAVYEMVIKSVERPMLEVVLKQAGGNQTLAAEILGINRNTLRKKLVDHKLIA